MNWRGWLAGRVGSDMRRTWAVTLAVTLAVLVAGDTVLAAARSRTGSKGTKTSSSSRKSGGSRGRKKDGGFSRVAENRDSGYYASIWERFQEGNRKQRQEVIKTLKAVIKANPEEGMALYYLGLMTSEEGNDVEAEKYLEAAVQVYPDSADIHFRLGRLLLTREKMAKAREHFEHAVRIDPEHAEAISHLGGFLLDEDKPAEALAMFQRAAELDLDDPMTRRGLGISLAMVGRHADAIEPLKSCIASDSPDPEVIYRLGKAYEGLGRATEATRYLEQAKQLGRRDGGAMRKLIGYDLARNLLQTGDLDQAAKEYRAAIKVATNPAAVAAGWMELGRMYSEYGRDNEAIAAFRKAFEEHPKSSEAAYRLARIHRQREEYPAALAAFEQIEKRKDDWGELARVEKAEVLEEQANAQLQENLDTLGSGGTTKARMKAIDAILQRDPKNRAALEALFELQREKGDTAAALETATALKQLGYLSNWEFDRFFNGAFEWDAKSKSWVTSEGEKAGTAKRKRKAGGGKGGTRKTTK